MTPNVVIHYQDLVLASVFLFLNAGVSLLLSLGLERKIGIAALRMILQLSLIGIVLKVIFAAASAPMTLAAILVMGCFAAYEIRARQQKRLPGLAGFAIGATSMMFAGTTITLFALIFIIGKEPWWHPQFSLPLFGMILGNIMTGISLALDTLNSAVIRERSAIEAQLLLGKTRWQAMNFIVQRSVRSGFIPIINSMSATGVVSLPGMMTGQILAGVDPQEAVKYQLLIMFLIAGATGIGVILSVSISIIFLTDHRHRLRIDLS